MLWNASRRRLSSNALALARSTPAGFPQFHFFILNQYKYFLRATIPFRWRTTCLGRPQMIQLRLKSFCLHSIPTLPILPMRWLMSLRRALVSWLSIPAPLAVHHSIVHSTRYFHYDSTRDMCEESSSDTSLASTSLHSSSLCDYGVQPSS